jgi:hypothetical protein
VCLITWSAQVKRIVPLKTVRAVRSLLTRYISELDRKRKWHEMPIVLIVFTVHRLTRTKYRQQVKTALRSTNFAARWGQRCTPPRRGQSSF